MDIKSAIEESLSIGQPVRIEADDVDAAYDEVRSALGVSYEEPRSAEIIQAYRGQEMHVHGHDTGFQAFHIVITRSRTKDI